MMYEISEGYFVNMSSIKSIIISTNSDSKRYKVYLKSSFLDGTYEILYSRTADINNTEHCLKIKQDVIKKRDEILDRINNADNNQILR